MVDTSLEVDGNVYRVLSRWLGVEEPIDTGAGKKLYEEVLSNTENTIPTTHDRIRIAKVREYDYAEACAATEQLEQFARMVNVPDTVCLMKKIVPEFKSKNSEFEQFDKVQPA
jgi:FlaA1/EpsC-like NDP-sugar epimerase